MAIGQTLAGIALILGLLAGFAAFFGGILGLMTQVGGGPMEPLVFAVVVWLVLAGKSAGWIGLDRWLLPLLGMPWRGGALLGQRPTHERTLRNWRKPWNGRRILS